MPWQRPNSINDTQQPIASLDSQTILEHNSFLDVDRARLRGQTLFQPSQIQKVNENLTTEFTE